MAKKNKVIIENIELKPQTVGLARKNKTNIGRVIFIFIVFILVVAFLPDITIYINELMGKPTNSAITGTGDKNKDGNKEEVVNNNLYQQTTFTISSVLDFEEFKATSFQLQNNVLTFVITNKLDTTLDMTDKKLFIETYDNDETLLERFKIDVPVLAGKKYTNMSLNVLDTNVSLIALTSKTINDYPEYTTNDINSSINIVCTKDNREIKYIFNANELLEIEDKQNYVYNPQDTNYNTELENNRKKLNEYGSLEGTRTNFLVSDNGYSTYLYIDLSKNDLSKLDSNYYYKFKTIVKEVYFEMPTYGFNCN